MKCQAKGESCYLLTMGNTPYPKEKYSEAMKTLFLSLCWFAEDTITVPALCDSANYREVISLSASTVY